VASHELGTLVSMTREEDDIRKTAEELGAPKGCSLEEAEAWVKAEAVRQEPTTVSFNPAPNQGAAVTPGGVVDEAP
jgi:hypothetical protein